jgi:hypothetical protein
MESPYLQYPGYFKGYLRYVFPCVDKLVNISIYIIRSDIVITKIKIKKNKFVHDNKNIKLKIVKGSDSNSCVGYKGENV